MSMVLTKNDLAAIGTLIEASEMRLENRVIARIDDLDDVLSLQMEQGLQEVRNQITAVDKRLSNEIAKLGNELAAVDERLGKELAAVDERLSKEMGEVKYIVSRIRQNMHAV